jgi:hypothetical protein
MSEAEAKLAFDAWNAAVTRLGGKVNVASLLRSAEWAKVPLAIRERAFFSAGVEDARVLQTIRSRLEAALQGSDTSTLRDDGTPMSYSRADAIADIRADLEAEGDSGKLTDIKSFRRQKLIQDFQIDQATSYGRYMQDVGDPEILDMYPAQRLVRVEPRQTHRDWATRWREAGGKVGWVGASRTSMVALKTSPIWAALSRFGTPFPPYDFSSGMGIEDVDFETAKGLGLVDDKYDAAQDSTNGVSAFNKDVQASLRGVDQSTAAMLKTFLDGHGVGIKIDGENVLLDS